MDIERPTKQKIAEWHLDPTQSVRQLTEPEKAWLAGVLDSEGCVGLYAAKTPPFRYYVTLQMSNTDKAFVEQFRRLIGVGGMVIRKRQQPAIWGRKPQWQYILRGFKRWMEVIDQIYPYLIVKKAKVDVIRKQIETIPFGHTLSALESKRAKMKALFQDPIYVEKRRKRMAEIIAERKATDWYDKRKKAKLGLLAFG